MSERAMNNEDTVEIELSNSVALVLFEYLSDYFKTERAMEPEEIALNRLLGALEKRLVEPFMKDYLKIVNEAKRRLYVDYHG